MPEYNITREIVLAVGKGRSGVYFKQVRSSASINCYNYVDFSVAVEELSKFS